MRTKELNKYNCFVSIDLGRQAIWKQKPEDTNPIVLQYPSGWSILSPLTHRELFHRRDAYSSEPEIIGIGNGIAYLRSQYIVFHTPSVEILQSYAPAGTTDSLNYFLTDFLPVMSGDFVRKLRFITKQAGLPSEPGYGFMVGISEPPMSEFPVSGERGNTHISNYDVETAISAESLIATDRLPSTDSISISDSLILDSIQALLERDFRRTLLYAAIALETFISNVLGDSYLNSLKVEAHPTQLRITDFTVSKGNTVKKDPIFTFLDRSSRTNFALLLHEIPLYLLNKSLQLDDAHLYQSALRLYRTRNKIVHSGVIPEEDGELFASTFSDAKDGLQTMLNVCYWFGMTEIYHLPGNGFKELSIPKLK